MAIACVFTSSVAIPRLWETPVLADDDAPVAIRITAPKNAATKLNFVTFRPAPARMRLRTRQFTSRTPNVLVTNVFSNGVAMFWKHRGGGVASGNGFIQDENLYSADPHGEIITLLSGAQVLYDPIPVESNYVVEREGARWRITLPSLDTWEIMTLAEEFDALPMKMPPTQSWNPRIRAGNNTPEYVRQTFAPHLPYQTITETVAPTVPLQLSETRLHPEAWIKVVVDNSLKITNDPSLIGVDGWVSGIQSISHETGKILLAPAIAQSSQVEVTYTYVQDWVNYPDIDMNPWLYPERINQEIVLWGVISTTRSLHHAALTDGVVTESSDSSKLGMQRAAFLDSLAIPIGSWVVLPRETEIQYEERVEHRMTLPSLDPEGSYLQPFYRNDRNRIVVPRGVLVVDLPDDLSSEEHAVHAILKHAAAGVHVASFIHHDVPARITSITPTVAGAVIGVNRSGLVLMIKESGHDWREETITGTTHTLSGVFGTLELAVRPVGREAIRMVGSGEPLERTKVNLLDVGTRTHLPLTLTLVDAGGTTDGLLGLTLTIAGGIEYTMTELFGSSSGWPGVPVGGAEQTPAVGSGTSSFTEDFSTGW